MRQINLSIKSKPQLMSFGYGITALVRPATSYEFDLAKSQAARIVIEAARASDELLQFGSALPFDTPKIGTQEWTQFSRLLGSIGLADIVASDWRIDGEEAAAPSPENLLKLFLDPQIRDNFWNVVSSFQMELVAEGNGSPASSHGDASEAAGSNTAESATN